MNKVFTSVILFVAISSVYCYSGGAPVEVCDSMIPNHPVDPQKSKFPYTVTVDKTEVKGGQKVAITIKGGDVQKSFKGYFLQVRNGEKAVGTFDISDSDKYSKAITCHEAKQVCDYRSINISFVTNGLYIYFGLRHYN